LSCDNCTGENGEAVTEKDFNKTLGSVFNNVKDWDGQRNVRRLLANAHQINNEEDNAHQINNEEDNEAYEHYTM